jgi:hypothetical protein
MANLYSSRLSYEAPATRKEATSVEREGVIMKLTSKKPDTKRPRRKALPPITLQEVIMELLSPITPGPSPENQNEQAPAKRRQTESNRA